MKVLRVNQFYGSLLFYAFCKITKKDFNFPAFQFLKHTYKIYKIYKHLNIFWISSSLFQKNISIYKISIYLMYFCINLYALVSYYSSNYPSYVWFSISLYIMLWVVLTVALQ